MKNAKILAILVLALGLIVCQARVSEAAPMGTVWTYQGRLIDANDAADGLYDFQFKLFDDPCTGTQQGSTIDVNDLDVIDGYFTAELDFGSNVFTGDARWLETTVSHADGSDPCTLSPRQEVTPVPYALQTRGIFVDDAGNVGIGETNPSEKLEVNGNININSVYKIGGDTVLSNSGTENIMVGVGSGANNTGSWGTFVGYNAGYNNQGYENTFLGRNAGYANTTGNVNTFLGENAGYANTEGAGNSFLGNYAGYSNTTGYYNTFVGFSAGHSNATGHSNTFSGRYAGYSNTEGNYNTFVGLQAGNANTTGSFNASLGYAAGFWNDTGQRNVFIGFQAGFFETSSDKLYIANGASASDVLVYGDFSTRQVGIGTTSPARTLHVNDVVRLEPRASAPSSPSEGDIYMDSTDHKLKVYDGTTWQACW